jgi:hypothetical protein
MLLISSVAGKTHKPACPHLAQTPKAQGCGDQEFSLRAAGK